MTYKEFFDFDFQRDN